MISPNAGSSTQFVVAVGECTLSPPGKKRTGEQKNDSQDIKPGTGLRWFGVWVENKVTCEVKFAVN